MELLPRALEIGLNNQLAVYDSVHIALAEKLGLPLITVDAKQATAATASGVVLKPITDFPEFTQ
jgi:predicted nucleic acid-binding protein